MLLPLRDHPYVRVSLPLYSPSWPLLYFEIIVYLYIGYVSFWNASFMQAGICLSFVE